MSLHCFMKELLESKQLEDIDLVRDTAKAPSPLVLAINRRVKRAEWCSSEDWDQSPPSRPHIHRHHSEPIFRQSPNRKNQDEAARASCRWSTTVESEKENDQIPSLPRRSTERQRRVCRNHSDSILLTPPRRNHAPVSGDTKRSTSDTPSTKKIRRMKKMKAQELDKAHKIASIATFAEKLDPIADDSISESQFSEVLGFSGYEDSSYANASASEPSIAPSVADTTRVEISLSPVTRNQSAVTKSEAGKDDKLSSGSSATKDCNRRILLTKTAVSEAVSPETPNPGQQLMSIFFSLLPDAGDTWIIKPVASFCVKGTECLQPTAKLSTMHLPVNPCRMERQETWEREQQRNKKYSSL